MIKTQILDIITHIFLLPSNKYFLIPFIIIGLCTTKRSYIFKSLIILLLTLIINPLLKSYWQIPLAPHLGNGFAFPSGHMQAAVVFWGFLAWEIDKAGIYLCVLCGLVGMGFSLVHMGYHQYLDVFGAVIFGLTTLLGYGIILNSLKLSKSLFPAKVLNPK